MMPAALLFLRQIASPIPPILPAESPPIFPVTRAFRLLPSAGGFAIGNNSEGELPQAGNTFQWTDNYTKTFGRHTFKFGGEIRRSQFNQFLFYNINGLYSFSNTGPDNEISSDPDFPAYPNYFLGVPTTYSQGAAQGENDRNTSP